MSDSPIIGVVDDARFEDHHAAGTHPERPERLTAARRGVYSVLPEARRKTLPMREAVYEELQRVHTSDYLSTLRAALSGGRGQLDPDTFHSDGTREAAWLAAGSCIEMARALLRSPAVARPGDQANESHNEPPPEHATTPQPAAGPAADAATSDDARAIGLGGALALVRPPGHHAEAARAMGFCLLNHIAIAAADALQHGASRVAIVDWDVHHGNGTQHIFESDPRVLYVSTHQAPFYPGTGFAEEIGTGDGAGFTANVPLPAGSDASSYGAAFREIVKPLLGAFQPDLVLVSAGYDAHVRDPLAEMRLEAADYGAMTSALLQHCEADGHRRLGLVLEGGYDLDGLQGGLAATGHALLGETTPLSSAPPPQGARRAIETTRRALVPYWPVLRE